MVPPQRLPARHQPHPEAARRHRTPRRAAQSPDGSEADWQSGPPPTSSSATRRFSATKSCAANSATTTLKRLRGLYDGRVPGGADLVHLLVREGPRPDRSRKTARRRPRFNQFHSRRRQPQGARTNRSTPRAFSKRGATRNGSTMVPPCAFHSLGFGPIFRLTSNRLDGAKWCDSCRFDLRRRR
jgi:hypothetical protein